MLSLQDNIKVVEVPIKDQNLQTPGCFWLSLQGLICLLFQVRQLIVDAYH